jgi:hypothetical protein
MAGMMGRNLSGHISRLSLHSGAAAARWRAPAVAISPVAAVPRAVTAGALLRAVPAALRAACHPAPCPAAAVPRAVTAAAPLGRGYRLVSCPAAVHTLVHSQLTRCPPASALRITTHGTKAQGARAEKPRGAGQRGNDGKRGYGGGRGINEFWDPNTMYYIIGANVVVFVLWQNHNLRRFMVEHFALSTTGVLKDLRVHTIFTSIISTPNFGMCLGNCVTLWFFGAECLGE